MTSTLFLLGLSVSAALDVESAAVLTGIMAAAAAEDQRVDVVTSEDLRRAIDVEAERRTMGCEDDQSCLAEIASAMGARLVLYGTTGKLEEETVITLQFFDSSASSSIGRGVVRAVSMRELSNALADQTRRMVKDVLEKRPLAEGERLRILVLDLRADAAKKSAPKPKPQP